MAGGVAVFDYNKDGRPDIFCTNGANIETLTDYSNQLSTLNNNLSAANSQIIDVDVAQESTNYAKYNILVQSGTAMLAQANAMPQTVLKLLA